MIDKKLIFKNLQLISQKLLHKGFELDIDKISFLEKKRKILQIEVEKIKFERNNKSNFIRNKKTLGEDTSNIVKEVNILKEKLFSIEKKLKYIKNKINQYMLTIPNIPSDDTPTNNIDKEINYWGTKDKKNFKILDHVKIGSKNNEIDFYSGIKLAGSRFVVIKGQIAMLYRALSQFMLDVHITQHGYLEVIVPYLVNEDSLYGTGQLPKFSKDLFHVYTLDKSKKYALIPTAEVPITNILRNEIINEKNLPIKIVSYTSCFRSEAGSYGKDTRGLIRMHQFDKVELVHFSKPEESNDALMELVKHAEKILKLLNLHYRKTLLCSQNMNFGSSKTYDLEVWLPAQEKYREVSSCSNMSDFQSRRMKTRYKNNKKQKKFLHTLNGSGLAIGRTLIAILENYQQSDGLIKIPEALIPYMKGLKFIG